MNIKFILPYEMNFGEKDAIISDIDSLNNTQEFKSLLYKVKEAAISRLIIFENEINAEEKENPLSMVLIDFRTGSLSVKYYYPEPLKSKMIQSITEADFTVAIMKHLGRF